MNHQVVLGIWFLDTPSKKTEVAFAEACLSLTPVVSRAEGGILLDVTRSRNLYSVDVCLLRIRIYLKRFHLTARTAVASDPASALAMACFRVSSCEQLPVESARFYLNPWNSQKSLDLIRREIQILNQLGVKKLSDFRRMPVDEIVSRFGKNWAVLHRSMQGFQWRDWPIFKPPEVIEDHTDIDPEYRVIEMDDLLLFLKSVFERVVSRLRGRGVLVQALSVTLILDEKDTASNEQNAAHFRRTWNIQCAFPQGSILSLLNIVREKLKSDTERKPLSSGVIGIHIKVNQTVPSRERQEDLFSKQQHIQRNEEELLSRLLDKMGSDRAFYVKLIESYMPEKSWIKSFTAYPSLIRQCVISKRPSRLLREPRLLNALDRYLFCGRYRWEAKQLVGPERIAGEWWNAEKSRDYYIVETISGEKLWIYRDATTQRYFLHGIFD